MSFLVIKYYYHWEFGISLFEAERVMTESTVFLCKNWGEDHVSIIRNLRFLASNSYLQELQ